MKDWVGKDLLRLVPVCHFCFEIYVIFGLVIKQEHFLAILRKRQGTKESLTVLVLRLHAVVVFPAKNSMLGEQFVIFLDIHAMALSHEVANFINIVLRTRLSLSVFSLLHNLSIIVLNKLCQIVPSRLLFRLPRARLLH